MQVQLGEMNPDKRGGSRIVVAESVEMRIRSPPAESRDSMYTVIKERLGPKKNELRTRPNFNRPHQIRDTP